MGRGSMWETYFVPSPTIPNQHLHTLQYPSSRFSLLSRFIALRLALFPPSSNNIITFIPRLQTPLRCRELRLLLFERARWAWRCGCGIVGVCVGVEYGVEEGVRV